MLFCLAGWIVLQVQAAQASDVPLSVDWASAQTTTIRYGGSDWNSNNPGQNITELYVTQDATNYYFRIDLAGPPANSGSFGPNDFAEAYGIDIAFPPGVGAAGGTHAQSNYIPAGTLSQPSYGYDGDTNGIDYIVMSHAATSAPDVFTNMDHLHTFDIGQPGNVATTYLAESEAEPPGNYIPGADFFHLAATEANGYTGSTELDWQIPKSALPAGPFTIYGSTVNSTDGSTYTVTGPINVTPAVVPEPSSVALGFCRLAVGMLLMWRRRVA